MYAETDLVLNQTNGALTVPIQAIDRNGSGGASVLLVDKGGTIELRQIQLGEEGSDRVEVRSGLSDQDEVVVGNRSGVRPGEKVQPKLVDEKADSAEAGA